MNIYTETIKISTNNRNEMINITNIILTALSKSKIKNGNITLFVPHTTAAVTINENADPDVKKDMLKGLSLISPVLKEYSHFEGNSDAHIKSSLIGVDQTILFENSQLMLGTWQGIYFCEFDGPRNRDLHIRIIGE